MTRRVALSIVGLAVVLLAGVVLPLGLLTASQDRQEFRSQALGTAERVSAAAEELLTEPTDATAASITRGLLAGERVEVLDGSGDRKAGTALTVPADVVRRALAGSSGTQWNGNALLAWAPVTDHEGQIGAVLLSRPTDAFDDRVAARWALLGIVSVLAVLAAAGLGVWLARWLGRPLRSLQRAATSYGDGHLEVRADTSSGPPEIRRLAEEFNRTAARLEQLLHGHRVLVADVAHEVRTPLAALRLRLDLLAQDAGGDTAEELAGALSEVSRLSRLVDGLLTAARAEAGSEPRTVVDVPAVLDGRVAVWRPFAEERGACLELDVPARAAVRAGEGHLEQIVDNLVANALDVGAARVLLRARRWEDHVVVEVVDDGPGLPEAMRQTALRRFEGRRPGGTGLGLSIVDRLATSDGGEVSLLETPGGGLTVRLRLPAA